MNKRRFRKN